MGTKRHHDDDAAEASSKRQKSYLGKKRPAQDDSGARKRARAIERSLRRNENLPANVRSNLERELASQRQIVEDKAYRKKRSAMISRYHMVRFFERKKASRLVKQLRRKLDEETDAAKAEKMRHELHVAEVDEAYTQYFPHLETYVGLYSANARTKHEAEEDGGAGDAEAAAKAALDAERPPMWAVVEKAMSDGPTALKRLRDRRSPTDDGDFVYSAQPSRPRSAAPVRGSAPGGKREERHPQGKPAADGGKSKDDKQQQGLNRRERRRLMRESAAASQDADGDEEGGGFFEGL